MTARRALGRPPKVGSKVSCWRRNREAGAAICTVCVVGGRWMDMGRPRFGKGQEPQSQDSLTPRSHLRGITKCPSPAVASVMLMRPRRGTQELAGLAGPPCLVTAWRVHGDSNSINPWGLFQFPELQLHVDHMATLNSLICNGQSGSLIETRTWERD